MKKTIPLLVAIVFSITNSWAQTSGTIMFGANLMTSSINTFDAKHTYQQNIQAKFAFFASDRVAVGLCLETGVNDNKTVPFGLTIISRYYTGAKPQQTFKFFVEGGLGLADNMYADRLHSMDNTYLLPDRKFRFAASLSAGLNLYATEWLAFEMAPEYRYVAGPTNVNRLGLSAGFKLYISKKMFLKTFPSEFKSLN